MVAKQFVYMVTPFEGIVTEGNLTAWFRKNKFTVKQVGRTLTLNRKSSIDPIQATDEIQVRLEGSKRTSNMSLNIKGIAIVINSMLTGNAGTANEFYLMNTINHYCNMLGVITIIFKDSKKTWKIDKVSGAEDVGADTSDNKKADLLIHSGTKYIPLSLKQENASFFGSIDAKFKDLMKDTMRYAIGERVLDKHEFNNGENRISPHIAITPSKEEQDFFLFGTDIAKNKGAIIKASFKLDSFEYTVPNTITIHVDKIWQSIKDFDEKDKPVIEIRNQLGRNRSDKEISGLRILATVKSKIPKNAVWLDRDLIENYKGVKINWVRPSARDEFEEVTVQIEALESQEMEGPSWLLPTLQKMSTLQNFTKILSLAQTMTVNQDDYENINNHTSDLEDWNTLDTSKKKRVETMFKAGKVAMPIIIKKGRDMHLLAGNTRMTYAGQILKKDTLSLCIKVK